MYILPHSIRIFLRSLQSHWNSTTQRKGISNLSFMSLNKLFQINNVLYQEGLVATLVRILARAALSKRASRLQARNLSYSSSMDIITVD